MDAAARLAPENTPSGEHRIPSTLVGARSIPSEGVAHPVIDTLRIMQLVDNMGRSKSLNEVCRLVTTSAALGRSLGAASILVRSEGYVLQETARHLVPGSPADFSDLSLTFPTPLALALASPGASTYPIGSASSLHPGISFPLDTSSFDGVWMLPLSLSGEPFALFLGFFHSAHTLLTLERRHEDLLESGLKLAIRRHSGHPATHPGHARLAS